MNYADLDLGTSELVYPPSEDTELAAMLLENYLEDAGNRDIRVLDMGTGSGALGITAAMSSKVSSVLFADKNDDALSLARKNVSSNKKSLHAVCSFVKTDLFSGIDDAERFEVIMFNPPYLPTEGEKSQLENTWNGGRTGVEVTIAFLNGAVGHLDEKGVILVVTSSLADEGRFYSVAEGLGLSVRTKRTVHVFFEDITAITLAKQ